MQQPQEPFYQQLQSIIDQEAEFKKFAAKICDWKQAYFKEVKSKYEAKRAE